MYIMYLWYTLPSVSLLDENLWKKKPVNLPVKSNFSRFFTGVKIFKTCEQGTFHGFKTCEKTYICMKKPVNYSLWKNLWIYLGKNLWNEVFHRFFTVCKDSKTCEQGTFHRVKTCKKKKLWITCTACKKILKKPVKY